jgi:hypothetical protein
MFQIPTADDLVEFIKDFTGSTNDTEIKKCIFMAELSMRNIELPALRCDPYAPENIGVVNQFGQVPIPGDMNKPILFFKQGQQFVTSASATGIISQTTIVLTSIPQQTIQVGMLVSGTGIGANCTVYAAPSSTIGSVITLTVANAGAVSGTITFTTVGSTSSQTGPWIVYDRIGDRDIITQGMIAQLYLQPVNVPAVIRGKFSEVGQVYEFLPYVAQGDLINMYYYKAWPLLFAPIDNTFISATGNVDTVTGAGPYTITVTVDSTDDLFVGAEVTAIDGTGGFGNGATVIVTSITNTTTFIATSTGGTAPFANTGTVANVEIINQIVQSNAVLQTWCEGYVYSTLREYYIKRHNPEDAAIYASKYDNAWNIVEDQNNLGKWSGGHTRLTSVWQPRQYRQYNIK